MNVGCILRRAQGLRAHACTCVTRIAGSVFMLVVFMCNGVCVCWGVCACAHACVQGLLPGKPAFAKPCLHPRSYANATHGDRNVSV